MSKATELADAEAAKAEAETPDDEPTEPTEPDAPVDPALIPAEPDTSGDDEAAEDGEQGEQGESASAAQLPPDAFAIGEELGKKLDHADRAQARALELIAAKYEQDTVPCPICERVDIAPRLVAKIAGIPAEGWAQIMSLGGVEPDPEHEMAEGVIMCTRCNGYGELDYPTRNPHMSRQNCPACAGNGYVPEVQAQQTVVDFRPIPSLPTTTPPIIDARATHDAWGRPLGHPHYNLDPAAVMP